MRHSRKKGNSMGRRLVQLAHDLQGRLPDQSTKVQVRTTAFPSECVSIGHSLLIALGWGKRLASSNHYQADSLGHSRLVERAQHQGSSSSRGLHDLLVRLFFCESNHLTIGSNFLFNVLVRTDWNTKNAFAFRLAPWRLHSKQIQIQTSPFFYRHHSAWLLKSTRNISSEFRDKVNKTNQQDVKSNHRLSSTSGACENWNNQQYFLFT